MVSSWSSLNLPKHKGVSQGALTSAVLSPPAACAAAWPRGSRTLRAQVSPGTLMLLQALLKPEVRRGSLRGTDQRAGLHGASLEEKQAQQMVRRCWGPAWAWTTDLCRTPARPGTAASQGGSDGGMCQDWMRRKNLCNSSDMVVF